MEVIFRFLKGLGGKSQKFKFEKIEEETYKSTTNKTIADGIYAIESGVSSNYVLDIESDYKANNSNIRIYEKQPTNRQKFQVKYLGDGTYSITGVYSNKALDVEFGAKKPESNICQYTTYNPPSDNQKWIIKSAGGGYYYIISKASGLYLDVYAERAENGTNVQIFTGHGGKSQQFKFIKPTEISINTEKYPKYSENIEKLMELHPGWSFDLTYTNLRFDNVIAGETALHSRNLVPVSSKGEWVCSTCGTRLYDSGWYCASSKAVAYYMDPRNFLDENNIFQFQDVNEYLKDVCTLEGIKSKVNGTFLQNYAKDIDNACKNKNVNSYYIISRVLQEQGSNGTTIGKGMDGGNGKTYYNPFNIGATGNGYNQIYANALAYAKSAGWDSMQKGLEGGIEFCKKNWLAIHQNTLYLNKFDVDSRSGGGLYSHQYMQNLMAACSEATILRSMYANTNKVDSNFTFVIPMYDGLNTTISQLPVNSSETLIMNVKVTANGGLWLRKSADSNSAGIKLINNGEILLSVQRGINSNWHKIVLEDGTIGYMSGEFLKQVDDVSNCNYKAKVKTADGIGCKIRLGPGLQLDSIGAIPDNEVVTVLNEKTYNNIDGFDWYRIRLSNRQQAFMPSKYLVRV